MRLRTGPEETPTHRLSGVSFGLFSGDEIKQLSVKEIVNPETFDALNNPNPSGLYDSSLGPFNRSDTCTTCRQQYAFCPGHMGHIQLVLPVYHPVLFKDLLRLLKISCFHCHGLVADRSSLERLIAQLKTSSLNRRRLLAEFFKSLKFSSCSSCKAPVRGLRQESSSRIFLKPLSARAGAKWAAIMVQQEKSSSSSLKCRLDELQEKLCSQQLLAPTEVREHLRELWKQEEDIMVYVFGVLGVPDQRSSSSVSVVDLFFLEVLPVSPTCFRPVSEMRDRRFVHPETQILSRILVEDRSLRKLMVALSEGNDDESSSKAQLAQKTWLAVQMLVNGLMDSDLVPKSQNPDKIQGIRQTLEKKEGLFRRNMMGKRVDFAARSVISPDLNINADEIGIPEVFAKRLTYPQPVTSWNVRQLRQAVINGPDIHPGAYLVEHEDGSRTILQKHNLQQRQAVAKQLLTPSSRALTTAGNCKKVHRHLVSGDILLLNRQPTLHRPSIMAHKARVLPGEKTIRLHYANCKSYNADFDGDEMNAHFPQNELARSEAYNLASTRYQYLVPKDGSPLSGLIQDHNVSGVIMTMRGRMFDREDYFQLLFCALPEHNTRYKLLPPCIMKPQRLWSGKQIISTLLLNIIPGDRQKINLDGSSKISEKAWSSSKPRSQGSSTAFMSESKVIFRQGELLCGVLDKAQFGSTPYSLVHACYELYGGSVSSQLLSALARLFTSFLRLHGFSLGVEDILVKKKANNKRWKLMDQASQVGDEAVSEALGVSLDEGKEPLIAKQEEAHHQNGGAGLHAVDFAVKERTDKFTNDINVACIPSGLEKPFPQNCLQLMVQSGAKGSMVNCMQISCLLGQIELEGHRPPLMPSGRSLPSFQPYDTSPRAGGFVDGRFLTGIQPQEYFFHCMAGREGLVDTAVKTSRSGYLQRCLIKHLEGLQVSYDLTVRDSDGSVIQFYYGEDSLDILKTRYLDEKQLPFIQDNFQAYVEQCQPGLALECLNTRAVPKYKSKLAKWLAKHSLNKAERREHGRQKKRTSKCPDPVISRLRPDHYFGSVCERIDGLIKAYTARAVAASELCLTDASDDDERVEERKAISAASFDSLVRLKHVQSLVEPGECVGLLAAQSIGEPSTQMTLNTFHFAGRGEMNVTLGIPRLREILMTASAQIKTPAMDVPLLKRGEKAQKDAKWLKHQLTSVTLSQLLRSVDIWESIGSQGEDIVNRVRQYRCRFNFLPHDAYKEDFIVTPEEILRRMEAGFFRQLASAVTKEVRVTQRCRVNTVRIAENVARAHEEDEGPPANNDSDSDGALSDIDEASADATSAKQRSRKSEQVSYEGPDADEEEIDLEMMTDEAAEDEDPSDREERGQSSAEDSNEDEEMEAEMTTRMQACLSSSGKRKLYEDRCEAVVNSSRFVVSYNYDQHRSLWCEVVLKFPLGNSKVLISSIVDKLTRQFVVHKVEGIQRCFISESTEQDEVGVLRLKTEGVELKKLWAFSDRLDIKKLYTNNIHHMAETYGIEAARQAIVKEIASVFKVYGIVVNPRHLSLIADYMTFEGAYKAFSRIGIESNQSPFQKMSFETTTHFLRQATLNGDSDFLDSPSARIVAGRVVTSGTGCMDILQQLQVSTHSQQ